MKVNQVLIKTGLTKLDAMIGGFRGGELAIIVSSPSMGKTALLQTIINNRPEKVSRPYVLYFPLNLPMLEARLRLDCLNARVDYLKASWWKVTQDELYRLKKARRFNFDDSTVLIYPGSSMELSELVKAVTSRSVKGDLKVVVIDSLSLGMDRKPEEVARIGNSLRRLAKQLNLAIITSYRNSSLALEDLKNFERIEKIADKIIHIHRDSGRKAQLIVVKNQNGPTGAVDVKFLRRYISFCN